MMKRLWLGIAGFLQKLFRRARVSKRTVPAKQEWETFRIVTGPAGTGKTAILRTEAIAVMNTDPSARILILTSSEREATSIISSLPGYDQSRHFIGSIRALLCSLLPPSELTDSEDLVGTLLNYLDSLNSNPLPSFTHIFVDEAQNLTPAMLRIIQRLALDSRHSITCFADPAQAIFGFAGATSETLSLLRAKAGNRIVRLKIRRRPMPVIQHELIASDSLEAVELAVRRATALLRPGETTAILTRTNNEAADADLLLNEQGIDHSLLSARLVASDNPDPSAGTPLWRHYALRFADCTPTCTGGITVSTVHTFRDRTADHVIVLDTALKHPADDPSAERRRLHTGLCRATKTAVVIKIPGRNRNPFLS